MTIVDNYKQNVYTVIKATLKHRSQGILKKIIMT